LACLLLAVALFGSCQKQRTKKQVEKLLSAEIVISDGINQVLFGRDAVKVDTGGSPARLVIYIE
jgi:hypothetical protein